MPEAEAALNAVIDLIGSQVRREADLIARILLNFSFSRKNSTGCEHTQIISDFGLLEDFIPTLEVETGMEIEPNSLTAAFPATALLIIATPSLPKPAQSSKAFTPCSTNSTATVRASS